VPRMYQRTYVARVAAPPDRVFPLLCPVREREWVPGWDAEVVRSDSGVAELGCVFRTREPPCTWIVHAYAPPRRIAFTLHAPDLFVELLAIELAPDGDGTSMTWRRDGFPLDGGAALAARYAGADARHAHLFEVLARFVEAGG
jgi:uncharacterized protein YndB with AHSA1/START domain